VSVAQPTGRERRGPPPRSFRSGFFQWMRKVLGGGGFKYAADGIMHVYRTQKHMRFHFFMLVTVLLFSKAAGLPSGEVLVLLLTISLVLIAEMFNTAIEAVVDLVTQTYHPLAKFAKDIAAGAVLMATLNALAVGLILFTAGRPVESEAYQKTRAGTYSADLQRAEEHVRNPQTRNRPYVLVPPQLPADPAASFLHRDYRAWLDYLEALKAVGIKTVARGENSPPMSIDDLITAERGGLQADLQIHRPRIMTVVVVGVLLLLSLVLIRKVSGGRGTLLRGGVVSGHTALGFFFAVIIFFTSPDYVVRGAAIFLALLMAQSRVDAGIHTVREVVYGGLLGTFVAGVVTLLR